MQQPPNYYGNSYPQNQGFGPGGPGFGNNPYMNKPDYPTPTKTQPGSTPPPPPATTLTDDSASSGIINNNKINDQQIITVYCTFPDSALWHDKVFTGRVIQATNESLTVYDDNSKLFTTILSVYVNYVEYTDPNLINRPRD